MLLVWLYFFLGLTTLVASSANNVFTNSFLVRFHRSIENDVARDVAARNGFESIGEVSLIFSFHFSLEKKQTVKKNYSLLIEIIFNIHSFSIRMKSIRIEFFPLAWTRNPKRMRILIKSSDKGYSSVWMKKQTNKLDMELVTKEFQWKRAFILH